MVNLCNILIIISIYEQTDYHSMLHLLYSDWFTIRFDLYIHFAALCMRIQEIYIGRKKQWYIYLIVLRTPHHAV